MSTEAKHPPPSQPKSNVLKPPTSSSSPLLRTTFSLISLQLFSRLFSFSLNQLLLRSTTPEALGIATIGFDVARDTGLFFIREGLRGAVIRTRSSSSSSSLEKNVISERLIEQTLYLPILLSPLLIFLYPLSTYVLTSSSTSSTRPPFFHLSLTFYIISAFFELFSEPAYLTSLRRWETLTSKRVKIEGIALGVKATSTLLVVMGGGERYALLAFGVGQVGYGLSLWIGMQWSIMGGVDRKGVSLWGLNKLKLSDRLKEGTKGSSFEKGTKRTTRMVRFDPDLISLGWTLTKQSFIKQILTEADKLVIGQLSTTTNASQTQGGYALALNYGSLIVRILFQPLEEASRLFFATNRRRRRDDILSMKEEETERRNSDFPPPSSTRLIKNLSLLTSILLFHTHLSLIFLFLTPSYLPCLLYHSLGTRWYTSSSVPSLLQAYFFFLPFLAINGITEAYFQSLANEKQIVKGSYWMGFCSFVFIAVVVMGQKLGLDERGLILANGVNMSLRIGYSFRFIWKEAITTTTIVGKRVEEEEEEEIRSLLKFRNWLPKLRTIGFFGLANWVVRWSEKNSEWKNLKGLLKHLSCGALVGLSCLGFM